MQTKIYKTKQFQKFQNWAKRPAKRTTLHDRKNPRVKFKLQEHWRPRNMQPITDFFVPKVKTLLNTLPTDLKNIIDEYTQPRYKKPMHGKIMKDFLALIWKQINARCFHDGVEGILSGLYIGKPKYKSTAIFLKSDKF